jgi:hypothetical protein
MISTTFMSGQKNPVALSADSKLESAIRSRRMNEVRAGENERETVDSAGEKNEP